MIAVQGPNARDKVWRALPASEAATKDLKAFSAASFATPFGEVFAARTGYTGEDGFELIVPATSAEALWNALRGAGVRPAGLGARDTLRLEAGLNLYGQDMDEDVTPFEAALAWTVALDEGRDFIGRAALEKQKAAGVPRQMVGLVLDDKGVLRAHQAVHTPHGDGEITSGTFSPTMRKSIALARVPRAVADGEIVRVDVRGRELPARVVKPPFVRQGRILVE